jgi:hypothetical protein
MVEDEDEDAAVDGREAVTLLLRDDEAAVGAISEDEVVEANKDRTGVRAEAVAVAGRVLVRVDGVAALMEADDGRTGVLVEEVDDEEESRTTETDRRGVDELED